jgi:Holliday junction resolvase-like predicted endonuclease
MEISTNKLAKKMNIDKETLLSTLQQLNLIKDKTTLTPKGKKIGGEIKRYMGSSYIRWKDEEKIKKAITFQPKKEDSSKKTTQKEKIEKGELYEEFIAMVYKLHGFTIWEHGKDKGVLDKGIDLIVKKDKKIILIQCKNWNEKGKYQITHKDIKAFRMEGLDFIEKNQIFQDYELHFKYILSSNFIHSSAIHHIQECHDDGKNVSYQIIEMPIVK